MDLSIARSAIESLYFDTATIIEYREVVDSEDGSTNIEEVVTRENVPCKLSYYTTSNAHDGIGGDAVIQRAKLFISNDVDVKAGSKIIVTVNGVPVVYKNSGEPSRYINHQEIKIQLWEDMA